ncbi:MAG: hypothetical protein AB8A35_08625 [Prochlorococcus sp.]
MASSRYRAQPRSLLRTTSRQARQHSSKSRRFNSDFERDLAAMGRVWRMLRQGTMRWFGEVGRQY